MKINSYLFKTKKIKYLFKTSNILFICYGINRNSNNWVYTEQKFKNLLLKYYKITNNTGQKALKKSKYNFLDKTALSGSIFLLKAIDSKFPLYRIDLNKKIKSLFFEIAILKINNNLYSPGQINILTTIDYRKNKIALCKLFTVNLKFVYKTTKNKVYSSDW